jgi:signal transduction histidine kinase
MSFRTRLLVAFVVAAVIPLAVFGLGVRREMTERLTAQYELRVRSLVAVIETGLVEESRAIGRKLSLIESSILDDNTFRSAAVAGTPEERAYLLDYASRAMRLSGLSMLQIQDEDGRIVSSGHFRNEYDLLEPELPRALSATAGGGALVRARTAEEPFIALARVEPFRFGARRFTLIGGMAVDEAFLVRLAPGAQLEVILALPPGSPAGDASPGAEPADSVELAADSSGGERVVGEVVLPFLGPRALSGGAPDSARIVVSHGLAELAALRRGVDLWFLVALSATGATVLLLAAWLSARVSRPLADLARKTARIDLDRLDVRFESRRRDEIGTLSQVLGKMTGRLRASAARLREAERRATIGELARQVNHDVKNGLTPIRNVFRHLTQVARDEPDALPRVYEERKETIDSGIAYLEKLASSYARLYPRFEHRPSDVNEVVRQVLAHVEESEELEVRTELDGGLPPVLADPLVLRRIVENLVDNAIESIDYPPGKVIVATRRAGDDETRRVVIEVTDTGRGLTSEEVERVFDDFYTTRETGTGLGLSIVRRLVMDLDGVIRVDSQPGIGSRFTLELPATARSESPEGSAEEDTGS